MESLFRVHGPMVFRRARRILGNDADAEEAVQEVFVRALQSSDTFEARASVTTWLYRITTHWCLNRIRDRRRRDELWSVKVEPVEPICAGLQLEVEGGPLAFFYPVTRLSHGAPRGEETRTRITWQVAGGMGWTF